MKKLPEPFLSEFLQRVQREQLAVLHLGIATQEYERHKARLLAQAADEHAAQDRAVGEGLRALGVPVDEPGRHFHVIADGNVMELKDGQYVELA